jgi:hypothetical protein
MAHVVQDSKKQYYVKDPDPIRRKVEYVDVQRLNPRSEHPVCQVETGLGAPPLAGPTVVISSQYVLRPTALGFEGEEAIPGANVQDRLPREAFGEVKGLQLPRCRIYSRRYDAVTQIHCMEPLDRGNFTP